MATSCVPPAGLIWTRSPPIAGKFIFEPKAASPPSDTVWTDGSVKADGGAAAVQPASQVQFLRAVKRPHSSAHCELVALSLVVNFHPPPSLVLTDSLNSLQLLRSWDQRPAAKVLSCVERMEVRLLLDQWQTHSRRPTLEKGEACDEGGCKEGNLKALGNEQVDALAKQAADGTDAEYLSQAQYADAVQVHDATDTWIMDIPHAVSQGWWKQRRTTGAARRMWLSQLYPDGVEIDWVSPTIYFGRLHWKGVNSCMPRHRHS